MMDIEKLEFDENGLIPAIVADVETGEVLMLAYMNAESLKISLNEGRTCFWSRSRGELWRKGESSGNIQQIVSIKADCDKDALLVVVKKAGPACHTGADSCFYEDLYTCKTAESESALRTAYCENTDAEENLFSTEKLYNIIKDRQVNKKTGSYTNYLFEKGVDKILKKFGEEATEVIIAGKGDDKAETIYELADLVYHALVLMAEMKITPNDVKRELFSRFQAKKE